MKAERQTASLPEVVFLRDLRGVRPENAVGIGEFWYEPKLWSLPLSPAAKVLYAGLCSFLGHGEIHRKDLRATLKDSSDEGIAEALEELVTNKLLEAATEAGPAGYAVRAIG